MKLIERRLSANNQFHENLLLLSLYLHIHTMLSFSSVWLFLEDETELFNFSFSGNDQLLPSRQEGERLHQLLPNFELRKFDDSGHFLFLVLFSPFLFFFRHDFSCVSIQECIVIIFIWYKWYQTSWKLTEPNIGAFAGRQHWPGNGNQGNFLLSPWQLSWLCFRFHTTYTRWSQESNRIIQVKLTQ
jgi:hypothetical protein